MLKVQYGCSQNAFYLQVAENKKAIPKGQLKELVKLLRKEHKDYIVEDDSGVFIEFSVYMKALLEALDSGIEPQKTMAIMGHLLQTVDECRIEMLKHVHIVPKAKNIANA